MSKIKSLISRAPKRFTAVVAVIAAAIAIPTAVLAWGPDRPTYTYDNPAPHVTFNSITDNPNVGDERNFVRIREDVSGSKFVDNVTLTPGKVYEVMVFYHNNAADNLNESGKGIAYDTTLRMELPGVVKPGVNAVLAGNISASNATPGTVWDEAYGKNATSGDIALRYVADSAIIASSNGAVKGQRLPDSLFTTGAKLGYDALDGVLKGCNQYSGYVTFKFRVDQPNFTLKKEVSVDGKTWVKSAKAEAGSTVQYRITYQNTGTTQQDNVSIRDILPKNVSYVSGSSLIANSATDGKYEPTIDGVTTTGYNAGSYQPKGNAYFKFSAKIADKNALECGTNTLKNVARVTTTGGYKEDDATVTVIKECEKPEPKYVCKSLGITVVDRTTFKFSTSYTVENAVFKSVTYVIKDANGKVVDTKTSTSANGALTYTQATAGKYSVQATLTVTVNGQDKTATSNGCKGAFEVPKLPDNITVCELSTKKIITIEEIMFDATKHSKNLADCSDTPTPPEELPQTGLGENIVAITGLGALIASAAYYIASRRALAL